MDKNERARERQKRYRRRRKEEKRTKNILPSGTKQRGINDWTIALNALNGKLQDYKLLKEAYASYGPDRFKFVSPRRGPIYIKDAVLGKEAYNRAIGLPNDKPLMNRYETLSGLSHERIVWLKNLGKRK
ncbi:MAG: hypothetical protein ACYTE8_03025 [Planctomycetota bacterium]|jgi:hypothetical protein